MNLLKGVIVVLFLLLVLHLGLLSVAVAAAYVGLWTIVVVDLAAIVIVAMGLKAAFPAKRAVLTYREIKEKRKSISLSVDEPEQTVLPNPPVEEEQPEWPAELVMAAA